MHGTAGFLTHETCLVIEPGGGLKGNARHNRADGAWRFSKGRCCLYDT